MVLFNLSQFNQRKQQSRKEQFTGQNGLTIVNSPRESLGVKYLDITPEISETRKEKKRE